MNDKIRSNIKIGAIIIIFIISLICLKYYLTNFEQEKCLTVEFWKNKHNDIHSRLLKLLKLVKPILHNNNIIYWAHAGTLLGTIRHKGFIPWDDDIDLAILYEEDKINNLITELKQNNFIIEDHFFGFKIIKNNHEFIDIFYYFKKDDVLEQTKLSYMIWPKENYYIEEVFNLKYEMFENILLPVPNNYNSFLKRAFGDDYMNIFYINYSHYPFSNIIDFFSINLACDNKYNMNQLK